MCLSNLENLNAVFINDGLSQAERLATLAKRRGGGDPGGKGEGRPTGKNSISLPANACTDRGSSDFAAGGKSAEELVRFLAYGGIIFLKAVLCRNVCCPSVPLLYKPKIFTRKTQKFQRLPGFLRPFLKLEKRYQKGFWQNQWT